MNQPQHYSAKYRQFKSLSKKVNRLIANGKFAKLSKEFQEKLIQKLKALYQQLQRVFTPNSLKRILASAAALLGFQIVGNAQMFAPPVVDTLGLDTNSVYWKCPDLVDLDGDGDFDLLTGEYDGAFNYLENTGNAKMPAFSDAVSNPFGLDTLYFLNLPESGDLDGDGDFDILSTEYYNSIRYYENVGDNENPSFVDGGSNPFGIIPGYAAFGGYFYMPSLVDLDADGDLDLVVGGNNYDLAYYENTGTPNAPFFASPQKDPFGLPDDSTSYLISQTFADFDNDGDYDMAIVSASEFYDTSLNEYIYASVFKYFENIGTASSPLFDESTSSPFSIDTIRFTVPIGFTAADIDDDGDVDLIFGGYTYDFYSSQEYSGLYYMENLQNPSGIAEAQKFEISISPNPASDFLQIRIHNGDPENEPERYDLISQNGQRLVSRQYLGNDISFDIRSMSQGIYYLIARRNGRAIGTQKVVISR